MEEKLTYEAPTVEKQARLRDVAEGIIVVVSGSSNNNKVILD